MPKTLPKGWAKTTLGGVCEKVDTIQPQDSPDTKFTYVDIGSIDNKSNRIIEMKTFVGRDAPSRARQSVRKDDVLFSTVRTYLKKIARIEQDYPNPVASTGFTVIRAAEGVSPQFLFSQVLSEDFLQPIHSLQTGSSYPAVRDKDVFAQPIRLAPTREQERIVAKLEALLSRLAAGEAAARRALDRLERYRAAVLHTAVTGELTREWRKTHKPDETGEQLLKRLLQERRIRWEEAELKRLLAAGKPPKNDEWKKRYRIPVAPVTKSLPGLPRSWAWGSWNQISDWVTYGFTRPMPHVGTGVPIVTAKHVKDRRIDYDNTHLTTRAAYEKLSAKDLPQNGDILITKDGTIGRTAVVEDGREFCINQSVAVIWLRSTPLVRRYLLNVIESNDTQKRIAARARGVAIKHLSITDFAKMALPLPTLAEQEEIVREVDRRFTAADHLAVTLNRQLHRARATRQSLLREAFAGKLVLQDPNDEQASALLVRIRAAREKESAKPKKKRRTSKPRTKRSAAKSKTAGPEKGSMPTKVVSPATLEHLPISRRQVRLINLKLYDDFNSLKAAEFPFRNTVVKSERLSPLCLVGLNGSGKSNLIEALSEIFCHVELSLLQWKSISSKQRDIELRFDLEYQLLSSKRAKPITVRLEKPGNQPVVFKVIRDRKEQIVGDSAKCLSLLPRRVLGYSSGLNETISIPYFRTAAIYSEEVRNQARREKANSRVQADVLNSNTFFMDYEFNALILVSNYLLQPKSRLRLFREHLRIDGLDAFDIRYRGTYRGTKRVELTRELAGYLKGIQSCASSIERSKETQVFHFLNPLDASQKLKSVFKTAGNFFRALYKLSLLNALALTGKERRFFLREDARIGQLERPPTVSREDRIFSIENIRVNLTQPKRAVDYAAISDGEHQFLQVFGSVALFDEPGCVFLLDEPETHFNPQWRRLSIQWLADIKSTERQELMISTHSPFVVSGCHKRNVFKFVREGDQCISSPVNDETFGASYDFLLARLFSLETMIAGEAIEEMRELLKTTSVEKLRQAIPRFGESLEKRFVFERIAQLEQKKGKKSRAN
jgi:type I restriction enzyme S subunit